MKTNKRQFILTSILTIHLVITTNFVSAAGTVEVYKSSTCGCCGKWVDHLRDHGFTVNTHDVGNKEARARAGISPTLGSCHTALVDGYAIEGHVPAQDIIRLLKERPKAVGISVPDMPHGTPGMEGERNDPYDVLLIQEKGDTRDKASVFNRYRP